MGERYSTARELQDEIGHTDTVVCRTCGVFVMDVAAHDGHHVALRLAAGQPVPASQVAAGTAVAGSAHLGRP